MIEEAIPTGGNAQGAGNSGLVRVMSNSDIEKATQRAEEEQAAPAISALCQHVKKAWQAARDAKEPYYREMLAAMRQRRGEYDPNKLRTIQEQTGGSDVFMNLTKTKCKAAQSWLGDVIAANDERPFSLRPSPMPELPQVVEVAITENLAAEVQQLAAMGARPTNRQIVERRNKVADAVRAEFKKFSKNSATRMEEKIDDLFHAGGWYEALNAFMNNITTFKSALLRGPIFRKTMVLSYEMDSQGNYKAVRREATQSQWYAPSSFDIYPAPDSRGVNDAYLIERHDLRRSSLVAMRGVEGYSSDAIDAVLSEYGEHGKKNWLWEDRERQYVENRENAWRSPDVSIEAIEYSGKIQGRMLLDHGIKRKLIDDPNAEYEANIWVIDRWVIKAALNKHPLGKRNYYKASYEEVPGAFWGESIPEAMRDTQAVCNAVARALVNNVAVASGPQVEVFEDRLMSSEEALAMIPWKIWQTRSDPTGGGHKAINLTQPQLIANHLTRIYEFFANLADNHTGIPAYVYGNADVGGGGRTAAGLSMLMSGASKGLKQIVANIDNGIIKPSVEAMFQHLMLWDPDPTIKGDLEVVPKGSATLIAKEQMQIRRTEFLQATTNPIDLQIMGQDGRARLLREVVKSLDMAPDALVPDPDSLTQEAIQQLQAAGPQQGGIPAPGPQPVTAAGDRPTDQNVFPNEA